MREYVHLHRKIVASWVFNDPRRLQLFIYLLAIADERGRVEVSVNECAMKLKIPRTTIGRILDDMVKWNVIGMKTEQRYTVITICKYELYNTTSAEGWNDNGTITEQFAPSQEEKEEERERKFPPHPLIKKEKSEKREELSATPLRRKGENDGQGLLFQELKEEYDGTAVNTEDSTPKAPSLPLGGDGRGASSHLRAVLGCLLLQTRPPRRRARLGEPEHCRPPRRLRRHCRLPRRLRRLRTADDVRPGIPQPPPVGRRLLHLAAPARHTTTNPIHPTTPIHPTPNPKTL